MCRGRRASERDDTVMLAAGAAIDGSGRLALGDGVNSTTVAGDFDGSISVDGRDSDDTGFAPKLFVGAVSDRDLARTTQLIVSLREFGVGDASHIRL
jgi:hypothetical protein